MGIMAEGNREWGMAGVRSVGPGTSLRVNVVSDGTAPRL